MTSARRFPTRPIVIVCLAGLALVAACSDDPDDVVAGDSTDAPSDQLPADEPAYTGTITSVSVFEPVTEDCIDPADLDPDGSVSSDDPPICSDPARSPLGHVLVEEVPGEQTGDKISLRVDPDTPIWRAGGSGPVAIDFDDLAQGDTVDVWVDGAVADSYPQQGSADAIVVDE